MRRPVSKAFVILSLFAFILLGFSIQGFSTIYYVNTAADDGGDGTTQELTGANCAWNEISDITGLSAGDSVLFNKGNTWREQLTVPSSGSSGSPITFGAYGSGADPIINGADLIETWADASPPANSWSATCATDPTMVFFNGTLGIEEANEASLNAENEWFWEANVLYVYSTSDPDTAYTDPGIEATKRNYGITATDKSYITIDGLRIENTISHGIYVACSAGDVTYWIIDNVNIREVGEGGIYFNAASKNTYHLTVQNSTIYLWNREDATDNRAIYFYGNWRTDIIANDNIIEGDIPYGVDTNENNNAIQVENGARYTIHGNDITGCDHGIVLYGTDWDVKYNYIHQTGDDSIWIIGADSDGIVAYNLLIDSSDNAIDIYGAVGDAGKFYNNTCYDSGDGQNTVHFGASGNRYGDFRNNIFITGDYHAAVPADASVTACTLDNNLWFGEGAVFMYHNDGWEFRVVDFAEYQTRFSKGANSLNTDPLMTDPANDDFTLLMASPCIDKGTDVGLTEDYQGLKIRHAPDIGAHENQTSAIFLPVCKLMGFRMPWMETLKR